MGLAGCMNLVVNLLAIISLFYIYIHLSDLQSCPLHCLQAQMKIVQRRSNLCKYLRIVHVTPTLNHADSVECK